MRMCGVRTSEARTPHRDKQRSCFQPKRTHPDKGKTMAAFQKAVQCDPDNGAAYGHLSRIYFGQKQFDAAIEYYDRAKKLGVADPQMEEILKAYRK